MTSDLVMEANNALPQKKFCLRFRILPGGVWSSRVLAFKGSGVQPVIETEKSLEKKAVANWGGLDLDESFFSSIRTILGFNAQSSPP